MGKYYTIKQQYRKDRGYEIHGDVILPSHGDCFTEDSIEGAIRALKRIARDKGIDKRIYFGKKLEKKS